MTQRLMPYLLLLRPHSWIKNFFVFVPLVFAHGLFSPEQLMHAVWAFLAFCAIASAVYVMNDIVDAPHDRLHPRKKFRAIAAGALSPGHAWILAGALAATGSYITNTFVPVIMPAIGLYLVANIAYSFYFKRVAVLDMLMVAGFYVLRVSAGALAVGVPVSGWLLLATIFVSLFLVAGKRKAELSSSGTSGREVLSAYTPEFLNATLLMSVALLLVVYSIYTVTVLDSHMAVYSIFFVLLGVFRYLYLSLRSSEVEQPEKIIFSDFWIFISAVLWIAFMYVNLYA